jgi:hypothetical protein
VDSDADMDTSYVCYGSESVVNSDNCISENVSVCIKRLSVYKHMVQRKVRLCYFSNDNDYVNSSKCFMNISLVSSV